MRSYTVLVADYEGGVYEIDEGTLVEPINKNRYGGKTHVRHIRIGDDFWLDLDDNALYCRRVSNPPTVTYDEPLFADEEVMLAFEFADGECDGELFRFDLQSSVPMVNVYLRTETEWMGWHYVDADEAIPGEHYMVAVDSSGRPYEWREVVRVDANTRSILFAFEATEDEEALQCDVHAHDVMIDAEGNFKLARDVKINETVLADPNFSHYGEIPKWRPAMRMED